jgi:hypothetical protein
MRACSVVKRAGWLKSENQDGLFATRNITVSDVWSDNVILEYRGEIVSRTSIDIDTDSGYHTISISRGRFIDGSKAEGVNLAKCNDSLCKCSMQSKNSVRPCDNIQLVCAENRVVGVLVREVKEGEEYLTQYKGNYWAKKTHINGLTHPMCPRH